MHEDLKMSPLPEAFTELKIPKDWQGSEIHRGKVRDILDIGEGRLAIITTDRISAFDRILGHIPDKGQVLNQLSAWWFEKTKDIVPNHVIAVPDPNVMIVRKCEKVPLEIVVRGFITGTTDTSIWKRYEKGERIFGGMVLPDGLIKNMALPYPIVDPTTKAEIGHDQKVTEEEILASKIVSPLAWQALKSTAMALFNRGQQIAKEAGFILVDTKYEFGFDPSGSIILIDEVHTPDSSRFWDATSYEERVRGGKEPDNRDKELVRLWYARQGYRGDGDPPPMPEDLIRRARDAYINVYEKLTGSSFEPCYKDPQERIITNLRNWMKQSN